MKIKTYFLSLLFLYQTFAAFAIAGDKPLVFLLKLDAEIDPRTNRLSELALEQASEMAADYVIIEMDTYGGALNDADDIRTRVMEYDRPIYVFINKDAASAGALISIACDSIYMASGASIGAATVVTQDGTAAPDKYQSYMRSIMRSTAEANGRKPEIAEAMVDEDIEVEGISTEGKVITFSTSEAIKHGYCEAKVASIEEIMQRSGVDDFELYEYKLSASEEVIAIFLNPFVSGILIMIILGGIYFELQTPGVGFPLAAAVIALILYFTPYYLNGLAENWEILMFFVGLVLIGLEVFVIPGFGLAGIAGIVLTTGSLILVMLNNDWFDFSFVPQGDLVIAVTVTMLGVSGSFIMMFIGGVRLTESRMFKRVALQTTLDKASGYTSNFKTESFIGKRGTTYTIMRPSGKVMIDDQMHDAFTRGEYVEKDKDVEVIGQEGNSLKVKSV